MQSLIAQLKTKNWKDKNSKWFKSEKGMIIWTTGLGIIAGVVYAHSGTADFPSVNWLGRMGSGMATVAILSSVFNRYVIAVNREKSGEITKSIHELVAKSEEINRGTHSLVARSEQVTKDIHDLVAASEAVLSKRDKILETERKIEHFKQFLKREAYHNIRFPKLKAESEDSFGLEYTIRPVRHPETKEPLIYETEMDSAYVVYVEGPAHIDVMNDERLKEYEDSPIQDGEYAFCKYFNESWHLGHDTFPVPYEFYMSGKVGPVEHGQTANEFILNTGFFDDPFKEKKLIATLMLDLEGRPMNGRLGGCNRYEIYKDKQGDLFLSMSGSFPKKIYYTNPKDTYSDSGWYFEIESVRGYASGQTLKNIETSVLEELKKLNETVKKIHWHSTKRYKYEPPS